MSVDSLPSGMFRARVMIAGVRHSETFATRQEVEDWEIVTRAQAITGSLPKRLTVHEYSIRWLLGYATAPRNTRVFHETNVEHINRAIGGFAVAKVTPSDITRMLNAIIEARSPVRAKRHRPRRQHKTNAVLERSDARSMLLKMQGWQRDTALIQLGLGARYGEIAGLTPTMSSCAVVRSTSGVGTPRMGVLFERPRTIAIGPLRYRGFSALLLSVSSARLVTRRLFRSSRIVDSMQRPSCGGG